LTEDIYVHFSDEIPRSIRSCVCRGPGWYDIHISTKLTIEEQRKAYYHELKHIENGDLENDCCVSDAEWSMK
jgi:hypothetical protein